MKLPHFNLPLDQILARRPLILDLASGSRAYRKKAQGRVTLDLLDLPDIDVVCDLNEGFPFLPDDSVDEIYSHNTLEHISNLLFLMDEIHRVLKPDGKKVLHVPHFSNPYHYSDPTHHQFFGLYTFFYFSDDQEELYRRVPAFYFSRKFRVEGLRLRFSSPFRPIRLGLRPVEWIVNSSHLTQELYEHAFCYLIPCYGIAATLRPVKGRAPRALAPPVAAATAESPTVSAAVSGGNPTWVEEVWGRRIAGVADGYGASYSAERRVDDRLMTRALGLKNVRGLALDVGSFYPETPRRLARAGWSVVCVDLSHEVCRRVKAIAEAEGLRLLTVRCDAAALPFRNGAFDLVTDFTTAAVTPAGSAVIAEEARVLRARGLYILVGANRWTRSARANLKRQKREGGRHSRWGYFSPISLWELVSLTWKYRLRLISIDSETHTPGALGVVPTVLGRVFPFTRRLLGWRLGAAYVARPQH